MNLLRSILALVWRGLVGPPPKRLSDDMPFPHESETALYPKKKGGN